MITRVSPDACRNLYARLAADGVTLHPIDLGRCIDRHTLFSDIAEALSTPSDFGRNWDALVDLLREHLLDRPHALLFHGLATLGIHAPEVALQFTEMLEDLVADDPRLGGRLMWMDLPLGPVES